MKYFIKKNGETIHTLNGRKQISNMLDKIIEESSEELDWRVGWEFVLKDKTHFWVENKNTKVNKQ